MCSVCNHAPLRFTLALTACKHCRDSLFRLANSFTPFFLCYTGSLKVIDLFGPHLNITIDKRPVTIRSPLLLVDESNSVLKVLYKVTKPVYSTHLLTIYRCYSDLEGRFFAKSLISRLTLEFSNEVSSLRKCLPMVIKKKFPSVCKTVRLSMILSTKVGSLTINEMSFMDKDSCQGVVRTTTGCDFERGDSGVRNNLCGVKDWTIQDRSQFTNFASRWTHNTCPRRKNGYPLQKSKLMTLQCVFPVGIPSLQASGFSVVKPFYTLPRPKSVSIFHGKRQSMGRVLSLDPQVSGEIVGPAVADLPEVQHDPVNAILSLQFEMQQGGLHYLIIAAVCTSSPANDFLPLGPNSLHFVIPHFDREGRGGTICLDIHTFVTSEMCSTFVIQLQAGAIDTALTVDNILFAPSLGSTFCGTFGTCNKISMFNFMFCYCR